MITKTVKKYKPQIGMMSCVGVYSDSYPYSFGNYFSLSDGPYIVNMWAENLKEFVRRNNLSEIECTVFSDGKRFLGVISDPLVPQEWLHSKLCVTGHGWSSRELCEAVLSHCGLVTTNEICGCEKPEESPDISIMMTFTPRKITYTCHRCHRNWEG
jgi:hypothetical protein